MTTGRLLGSGRMADVYEIDGTWVLRRYRDPYGDAAAEAVVMDHVRGHGYPVPGVRSATRSDLVMERLTGPTMGEALLEGRLSPQEGGAMLARLLRDLHALPARRFADPAVSVLHLDLHPLNVIMTADGPKVIDWATAEEGSPGLDWGMSAVILAQVALLGEPQVAGVRELLAAMLAGQEGASALTEAGLAKARARRAANPTMTGREVEVLGEAEDLIRALL
ncbi:phosphotransferase [Streptomyces colonosanans]|uniref:Phosphotransferase enzyme family protein n=1 Tax=Streptomyces colonosanans TaxID=1428652 RepID=A0A1S2NY82_9ACTN|nr:phosphotransferase [Streptomyces colonosanans]OIJ86212.1 phosphotransferase enzyme family protein [Streptomyces colonosanans]